MVSKTLFSSATDNWETPQDFFNDVNKEFHFSLDACADYDNHKCERYYTKEQDALSHTWDGVVWCNPPYGKEIGLWCEKAFYSAAGGATVVMLLPARTDTRWFHNWVYGKAEIRFIKGRLKFGGSKNSAPFPSMLAIYKGV